jgi:ACS family tartrate transporter-like MFS transporter
MVHASTIIPEGFPPAVAARARQRIMRRILPYLFLLYTVAYLDRVNLGYAALQMTRDLRFGPEVYGFGAGIFFIGYFLLEVPGSILVERWSARRWIARIMITWGVVAVLTGFVQTAHQFYWVRFLLGLAEAGFFPGMIVYLRHWFRAEDRARAVAIFIAAQPISNILGAPLSGRLLGIHWQGWAGWRWLFVLEGLPAVVLGVVTLFYLTDWPHEAEWLPEDERAWLASELERERRSKPAHLSSAWHAVRQPDVVQVTAAYFLVVAGGYAFNFWMPTLIQGISGLSNVAVTMLSALPYCVGLAAGLLMGWSSDRTGDRQWHAAGGMLLIGVGLGAVVLFRSSLVLALAGFSVTAAGIYGYQPAMWSLITRTLSGTGAAASIGLANAVANLGGFVGPFIFGYLTGKTHSIVAGVLSMAAAAVVGAALIAHLSDSQPMRGLIPVPEGGDA